MRPFRQGDLDGLCGIYAIINALRLFYPHLSRTVCEYHLFEIFKQFHSTKANLDFIIDGSTVHDISRAFKTFLCAQYNLTYRKPFHTRSSVTLNELWDSMTEFLNCTSPRAILICIENSKYSHFTVVKSITANRLLLHDSDSRLSLNRRQLSTDENFKEAPTHIYPTTAFYIQKTI